MSAKNQKNSIEKLVRLIGVASVSALFSFPALAITNSNSNSFDRSVNNRTRSIDSTRISRQLLAQGTSGSGGAGGTGTGAGQTDGGAGGTGTGASQTGGGAGGAGTGAGQTDGGAGGTGTGAGQTGGGAGGTGTGAGQTGGGAGGAGTGAGGGQIGGGAGGTGTGAGQTGGGAGGTGAGGGQTGGGAGGTGAGGTNSSNGQSNGRQDAFTQSMNAGYTATQQRNYQSALTYFQRALQLRPNNPYAIRAVQNVQGYLRRGNNTTQSNQGNR